MKQEKDYGRAEILAGGNRDCIGGLADLFATENDLGLYAFADSDAGDEGGDGADFEVGSFLAETLVSGSLAALPAPDATEEGDLPLPPQQTGRAEAELDPVRLDDFEEGAARWAVEAIQASVRQLFAYVDRPAKVASVAAWLFSAETGPTSFENCCVVHSARPDVVRMRIHFELWRKGRAVKRPLRNALASLPEYIEQRLVLTTGVDGIRVAGMLWEEPGVLDAELRRRLSERELAALHAMAEMYIASPSPSEPRRWYLTGINPILEASDGALVLNYREHHLPRRQRLDVSWSSRFA